MSTLVRLVVTSILGIFMLSCNFSMNLGPGVDGNRNVITQERKILNDFNSVKISQGLELYLTQSNAIALSIEADENLHDFIITDVENGVLSIYATENIRRAASRRINLNVTDLSSIMATSGSDVFSTNTIKTDTLELHTTSGADMRLKVKTETLNCNSTSGSDIIVSGTTTLLIAQATSGSDIKASQLKAEISKVKATSGADISINTSKELTARATSGADITYSGNPEKIDKSNNSSGSVRRH
ncbi:head GIN domain-containing protein [uncultured Winogradskyella sp.]|uniref:head GIN domain-containing protein n=1 Tax=uncultured Winogradskyella sp. TaxID=395353 RepID=UPI00262DED18|nr:head GIN domain-containing protein [uncultured Winogradskyella sp.]